MKYLLIIFIPLFIFGCSTTSTYTQEKADAITDMERCFGINTGLHYWDLKKLDEDGYSRLVDSMNRLNPKRKYPIQEICGSEYYFTLTNRRMEEARVIEETRKQALRNVGMALQGLSPQTNNQNSLTKPHTGLGTKVCFYDVVGTIHAFNSGGLCPLTMDFGGTTGFLKN